MDLDSYGNSFTSLSDLSQMFAAADTPPTANDLDFAISSRCYSVVDRNPVSASTLPVTLTKSSCKADRTGRGGGRRLLNKERERRGKMASMYSLLHSFLPNLATDKQASREKIVTETIGLIKRLEAEKSRLEQEIKAKETFCAAATTSTVTISTSSGCVSASSQTAVAFEIKWRRDRMKQRTTLKHVLEVFGMYGAEILTAGVVVNEGIATASVTAIIVGGEKSEVVERIKRDLLLLQMERVTKMVSERPVVIFSKTSCCMCHTIKALLHDFGVNPVVYELDQMSKGKEIEQALLRLGSNPTVPSVFIGGELVGGANEIMTLHLNRTLRPMLNRVGALWV